LLFATPFLAVKARVTALFKCITLPTIMKERKLWQILK
jgi:hypothetical protein